MGTVRLGVLERCKDTSGSRAEGTVGKYCRKQRPRVRPKSCLQRKGNALSTFESWPEIQVTSWNHLKSVIDELLYTTDPAKPVNFFRGQADASWPLVPSLIRKQGPHTFTAQQAIDLEKVMLAEFQGQAHLHLSTPIIEEDDIIAWWGLMQHYRAPTRLLDWTMSALVAVYFAVVEEPEQPGAVWFFHGPCLRRSMTKQFPGYFETIQPNIEQLTKAFEDPAADSQLYVVKRTRMTDRMVAQQGLFTVCTNVLADHGTVIGGMTQFGETGLARWVVPPAMKPEILGHLRAANITASALFPGVDGLGRSLDELMRLTAHSFRSD